MSPARPSVQPELVELKSLIASALGAALSRPGAVQAAVDSVASATEPIDWLKTLEGARTDVHQAALVSALGAWLRWFHAQAAAGQIDPETLSGLVDAPDADLYLPLRLIGAEVEVQLDARINSRTQGGQLVLRLAITAAQEAYEAGKARFCLPGQRELWMRDLAGLRELKHQRTERHVAYELGRWPTDAEAYAAAGVSVATGDRIKRRLGLAKKRGKT